MVIESSLVPPVAIIKTIISLYFKNTKNVYTRKDYFKLVIFI